METVLEDVRVVSVLSVVVNRKPNSCRSRSLPLLRLLREETRGGGRDPLEVPTRFQWHHQGGCVQPGPAPPSNPALQEFPSSSLDSEKTTGPSPPNKPRPLQPQLIGRKLMLTHRVFKQKDLCLSESRGGSGRFVLHALIRTRWFCECSDPVLCQLFPPWGVRLNKDRKRLVCCHSEPMNPLCWFLYLFLREPRAGSGPVGHQNSAAARYCVPSITKSLFLSLMATFLAPNWDFTAECRLRRRVSSCWIWNCRLLDQDRPGDTGKFSHFYLTHPESESKSVSLDFYIWCVIGRGYFLVNLPVARQRDPA